MNVLYSGGLWTVFLILALATGYVWVLNWPRRVYWIILGAAIAVIGLSQILPTTHLFRISIYEGLVWWMWAAIIASPVLAYSMFVRWIKRKIEAKDDPGRS